MNDTNKVKWIKLMVDTFKEPKMKYIRSLKGGNDIALIWILLSLKAGEINNQGYVYLDRQTPFPMEILAVELDYSAEIVIIALKALEQIGLIKQDKYGILLVDFSKRQKLDGFESQKPEKILYSEAEKLWKLYPRKDGKQRAMKKLPILVEEYGLNVLEQCIKRFLIDVNNKKIEIIPYCATFFNKHFENYLDENYVSSQPNIIPINNSLIEEKKAPSKKKNKVLLNTQVEKLWQLYPNKKGKVNAMKKLPALIAQYGFDAIVQCIKRFENDMKGRELRYIPHGGTFFGKLIVDYMDEDVEDNSKENEDDEVSARAYRREFFDEMIVKVPRYMARKLEAKELYVDDLEYVDYLRDSGSIPHHHEDELQPVFVNILDKDGAEIRVMLSLFNARKLKSGEIGIKDVSSNIIRIEKLEKSIKVENLLKIQNREREFDKYEEVDEEDDDYMDPNILRQLKNLGNEVNL